MDESLSPLRKGIIDSQALEEVAEENEQQAEEKDQEKNIDLDGIVGNEEERYSMSPDLDLSPAKNPNLRKIIQNRFNDSLNVNNMSRRSIMKIKKAGDLNHKPTSEEEVKKRLLNLQKMDDNSENGDDENPSQQQQSKRIQSIS